MFTIYLIAMAVTFVALSVAFYRDLSNPISETEPAMLWRWRRGPAWIFLPILAALITVISALWPVAVFYVLCHFAWMAMDQYQVELKMDRRARELEELRENTKHLPFEERSRIWLKETLPVVYEHVYGRKS